jgi:hypothetical protein
MTQDFPGGISGLATLQNSIVANNSGGNCSVTMTSKGYNLSSDNTCNFNNSDRNNIDPMLGPLQYNGGSTQTMALPSGSPAIDVGNPSGCTDGRNPLKTDQRGLPRPNSEDKTGCDMGGLRTSERLAEGPAELKVVKHAPFSSPHIYSAAKVFGVLRRRMPLKAGCGSAGAVTLSFWDTRKPAQASLEGEPRNI